MKFGLLTALKIGLLGGAGSYVHYQTHGHFNWISQILLWFLSINFWICFWELALFYMYDSNTQLHESRLKTGFYKTDSEGNALRAKTPLIFFKPMSWKEAFDPKSMASIWIDYGRFDLSYADKRTFGYNIDVGNGHSTLIPTIFLYFALIFEIFSPKVTGMIGLVVYYQKWYGTLIYLFAYFNCGRYKQSTMLERIFAVFCTNGVWFTLPLIGIYAHISMIMNESFDIIF